MGGFHDITSSRQQSIPSATETFQSGLKCLTLAYWGNRDKKNVVLQKWCSAQNTAKTVLLSIAVVETR